MTYGDRIEQLLVNAFAGESQSRNRYTMFASVAKKEGLDVISQVFLETAENEFEHAKLFYKHIRNGHHNVESKYPFFMGSTLENLKSAMDGEHEEWETIYRNAADTAIYEGYNEVADTFLHILEVEKHHEHRFIELYDNLREETLFKKDHQAQWICTNCGYVIINSEAPHKCPCCNHEQGYFKLYCEKF
jgi:rubrerythrin